MGYFYFNHRDSNIYLANTDSISKVGEYAKQYFLIENIVATHLSFQCNGHFSFPAPTQEMAKQACRLATMNPDLKDMVALTTAEKLTNVGIYPNPEAQAKGATPTRQSPRKHLPSTKSPSSPPSKNQTRLFVPPSKPCVAHRTRSSAGVVIR